MFSRGKLLLVSLIFSSYFSQITLSYTNLLDASSTVIDDLYDGCRKEAMEKFVPGLLNQELDKSDKLQKAWKTWQGRRTSSNCTSQIPGGNEEHTSALAIYHFGDEEFIKELNNAVETMMVNVTTYDKDFHFKALHFLLMDSMMLLRPKECGQVYLIQDDGGKIPKTNSKVRFSSFTVVDSDTDFTDLADQTIFKIKTCFYVNLDDQLCLRKLGKLLLSPAEVFTVEKVEKKTTGDDEYTEVVLTHPTLQSNHNCVMWTRSATDIPTHLFLPLLVASIIFSMCP
ncbi:ecto-ADP-ribosyltransferase 5-like [Girardinichthys multiradiatus]|uniref:ecto-ADP-ribosyltransferase 5-like n=1 Tax=Girardinichthys multiradiatus TaxID=208333 RepID=UPI001FABB65E|nr:ecto-ADP-ribosyltransferase 5-like [Girardinichthys multiradiatus]XP_047221270.1 ecto-ADP-ribosyltransferase 5-like [Girardinichthys multiradiatus]